MNYVKDKYAVKVIRACRICGLSQSAYYYKAKKSDDTEIEEALQELAGRYPRRGFEMMFKQLRRDGYKWSHKRVYRVYCELKLNLRIKPKKRITSRERTSLLQPLYRNMCWSIDFMSDALMNGLRFRTFNLIDDFNRECLDIIAATSLPSSSVTVCLDQIAETRGYPSSIRTDNGPEFISSHFEQWARSHGITLIHIQPGKPAQNGYIERFNRTFREEILDRYLCNTITEVQSISRAWMKDYNHNWCHGSLDDLPPIEFAHRQDGLAHPGGQKNRGLYQT